MAVRVYGCNHVVIEVDDIPKAVAFYRDDESLIWLLPYREVQQTGIRFG